MIKKSVLFAHVILLLLAGTINAADPAPRRLFRKGEKHLEKNENHRAYLVFREIARDYPSSEYADDALFLIAQYYLQSRNYFQAENELRILIGNYPDSPYVDEAKAYISTTRSRFLEDKVSDAMNAGDYSAARIFLEEILAIDPSNEDAKAKLRKVDNILVKMDYRLNQLQKQEERLEEQRSANEKAREEVNKLREEAEELMEEAKEYEDILAKSRAKEKSLESTIAQLEAELNEWRERAKKHEASALAGNNSDVMVRVSGSGQPKILFEGPEDDPNPRGKEKIVRDILQDKSPSIVLLYEEEDEVAGIGRAEFVLSVDLFENWPKKHYLKFRVDYEPISNSDGPKPTIIYYTVADMDEADTENSVYKKRVILAIDTNTVQDYTVSAFFVENQ